MLSNNSCVIGAHLNANIQKTQKRKKLPAPFFYLHQLLDN